MKNSLPIVIMSGAVEYDHTHTKQGQYTTWTRILDWIMARENIYVEWSTWKMKSKGYTHEKGRCNPNSSLCIASTTNTKSKPEE